MKPIAFKNFMFLLYYVIFPDFLTYKKYFIINFQNKMLIFYFKALGLQPMLKSSEAGQRNMKKYGHILTYLNFNF